MPSYGHGNDWRFGRLFQQAWHRLPLGDRRRLLKFWREGAAASRFRTPAVQLVPCLPIAVGPDAIGHCNDDGSALSFLAPVVDALPDEAVMTLIAHEIAHAFLRALGIASEDHDQDDPWNEEERLVRETLLAARCGV